MRTNPIVEQARQAGQRYVESFTGDWKAMAEDLNRRAQAEGRQIVSRPPVRMQGGQKKAV